MLSRRKAYAVLPVRMCLDLFRRNKLGVEAAEGEAVNSASIAATVKVNIINGGAQVICRGCGLGNS